MHLSSYIAKLVYVYFSPKKDYLHHSVWKRWVESICKTKRWSRSMPWNVLNSVEHFYHAILLSIFCILFSPPYLLEISINICFLILNEQEKSYSFRLWHTYYLEVGRWFSTQLLIWFNSALVLTFMERYIELFGLLFFSYDKILII